MIHEKLKKWGADYWIDTGERVVSTAIYGAITMFTLAGSETVVGTSEQWIGVVGIPTVLSFLKCLAANLRPRDVSKDPTASLVKVASADKVN